MPDATWYMDGDQPTPIGALPILEDRFTKPYPARLWRVDENNEGLPYTELMPDILYVEPTVTLGAFQDAASLARARIPDSVKLIGDNAFAGTALKRVRIAADCEYNEETSFPAACIVQRYPDSRYGQLYDSAGKAVLDYDARRVYVLKEDTNNG